MQYYCFSTASATQDLAIYYYPETDTFWLVDGMVAQMGASALVHLSGVPSIILGPAATGSYLYLNEGDDADGTVIDSYLDTKRFYTEFGPVSIKRCRAVTLMTVTEINASFTLGIYWDNSTFINSSYDIDVAIIGGFQLDVSQLDFGVLGGDVQAVDASVGVNMKFTKMKFRVSDSSTLASKIRGLISRGFLVAA